MDNSEVHYMQPPTIDIERSSFNRQFRNLTTFNAGQLIPIWCDQTITFGDTVQMDLSALIRLATPLNPTMDNARIDYYVYAVPYTQIWKHTKEFYGENTTGAWTQTQNYEIPQIEFKWIKGLGGSKSVKLDYTITRPMGGGVSEVVYIRGTGAGINEAVKNADIDGVFYNSGSYVEDIAQEDVNALKGYYAHNSIADYLGIPDLGYNLGSLAGQTITATGISVNYGTNPIEINITGTAPSGTGTHQYKLSDMIADLVSKINGLVVANPTIIIVKELSAMPFRAYQLIYDTAFRNQNYIEPVDINVYNGDATISLGDKPYQGGMPERVNRTADYFSTCLPEPQKGDAVLTPIGTSAPVITAGVRNTVYSSYPLAWAKKGGALFSGDNTNLTIATTAAGTLTAAGQNVVFSTNNPNIVPANLVVDLSQAVAATINAQRLAFATQRILEKDARGGTRFNEIADVHFHVNYINPLEIGVPEYLGGESVPISISQVNQTSESATTPLGSTGGNSLTTFNKQVFTKSFTQPTILMLLAAVRTDRTYSQGIHRDWFKKRRLDFYYPALAHLGEMAVYNREIYADGSTTDDEVWGYQERWKEMRTGWKLCTGAMKPTYAETMDVWHYGEDYGNTPVMSKGWLQEDSKRLARTLIYDEDTAPQFISDWLMTCKYTRPMPIASIPGLIDHY